MEKFYTLQTIYFSDCLVQNTLVLGLIPDILGVSKS